MSQRYERRPERRRNRNSCLAWLVALVWVVLLLVLGYRFFVQPRLSQFIGQQLGEQLQGQLGPTAVSPGDQIQQGIDQVLPTTVAGLPGGELRVSEAEVNEYLATHKEALGPIESATVRFVPGEVQADISAIGTTSTARMGLAVQDGRIIAVDPQIDGPLGQVLSARDLARSLEQQINRQLAAQGRRIVAVQVEAGELLIEVE